MDYQIKHKRSDVEGKIPSATTLDYGEIAINYANGSEMISFKNNNDDIKSFNLNNIAGSTSAYGPATSANKLTNSRKITLQGIVNGEFHFDGSKNISCDTHLQTIEWNGSDKNLNDYINAGIYRVRGYHQYENDNFPIVEIGDNVSIDAILIVTETLDGMTSNTNAIGQTLILTNSYDKTTSIHTRSLYRSNKNENGEYGQQDWSLWTTLNMSDISELEKEFIKRLQGTSEKSNAKLDPHKYLGDFSDFTVFIETLDSYSGSSLNDYIKNGGYYRASVENELFEVVLTQQMQKVSGPCYMEDGDFFVLDNNTYSTVIRVWDNDSEQWGKWSYNNCSPITPILYDELNDKIGDETLIPGHSYRIVDYRTVTYQDGTYSLCHPFDIIVTAINKGQISHQAKVVAHEYNHEIDGDYQDNYSNNLSLEKYQVWYSLNDSQYEWVIRKKEVQYIKPLQCIYEQNGNSAPTLMNEKKYIVFVDMINTTTDILDWHFYLNKDNTMVLDLSKKYRLINEETIDNVLYSVLEEVDNGHRIFIPHCSTIADWEKRYITPKGVIYRMIDEYNNDCPYDFKNILFERSQTWKDENIDFSLVKDNKLTNDFYHTFHDIKQNCDDSLNKGNYPCRNNRIKPYTKSGKQILNNTIFLGNGAESNEIAENNYFNTFAENTFNNTFGRGFQNNIFSKNCSYNVIGDKCALNKFYGGYVSYNKMGNMFSANTSYSYFQYNTILDVCQHNTFQGGFMSNTLKDNIFSNYFSKLKTTCCTFGSYFQYNNFSTEFDNDEDAINNCTFDDNIRWFADLPCAMTNVLFNFSTLDDINEGQYLSQLSLMGGGSNIINILSEKLTSDYYHIYKIHSSDYAENEKYDIFIPNANTYIHNLGNFTSSKDAENDAATVNNAYVNRNKTLKYTISSSDKIGWIQQYYNPQKLTTKQVITWDGIPKQRNIEFIQIGSTISVGRISDWEELKVITVTEWNNINTLCITLQDQINKLKNKIIVHDNIVELDGEVSDQILYIDENVENNILII